MNRNYPKRGSGQSKSGPVRDPGPGRYLARFRIAGRRHTRLTPPEIELRSRKMRRGQVAGRYGVRWRDHPCEFSATYRDLMSYRNLVRRSLRAIRWAPSHDAVAWEEWKRIVDDAMAPVREAAAREVDERRAAAGLCPQAEDPVWGGGPRSLRELIERVSANPGSGKITVLGGRGQP